MNHNISQNIGHAEPGAKVVGVSAGTIERRDVSVLLDDIADGLKPGGSPVDALGAMTARLRSLLELNRVVGSSISVTQTIGTVGKGATVVGIERHNTDSPTGALREGLQEVAVAVFVGVERGDDLTAVLREAAARLQELLDGDAR